jgi:RNA polymerase sigma-70 factor (ECF subfamily)
MVTRNDPDTDELVDRARGGDQDARQQLLVRHRKRLRQMVALRMDRRLMARVDPSDVVQEALTDAAQELSDYLRNRPLPFYPWLRQLAWDRLIELHRRHLYAQKRSVRREDPDFLALPDESAVQLAQRLLAPGSSPSERVLRDELRGRVQAALAQLSSRDREVLVLRHLEQLSTKETAGVLGITPGAVKTQHLRALQRLRSLLGEDFSAEEP